MGQEIAFWIFAAVIVGAALGVVLFKNVFRAAVLLITCFLGTAGVFILLNADFIAALQVLIYVGAIGILVILVIMLTREVPSGSPSNRFRIPAMIIAALFCAGVIYVVLKTNWQPAYVSPSSFSAYSVTGTGTISGLADRLFSTDGYLLPVEIIPMVLLATILGAIVLVKDKKK